jgi:hypothetical protein
MDNNNYKTANRFSVFDGVKRVLRTLDFYGTPCLASNKLKQ